MKDTLRGQIVSYTTLVLVATFIGGGIGYLCGGGMLDVFLSQKSSRHSTRRHYREKAMEGVTDEQFEEQTSRGWWIGCGVGAAIGVGGVCAGIRFASSRND